MEVFASLPFPIQMICMELVFQLFQIINYFSRLHPSLTQTSGLSLLPYSLQLLLRFLQHNYCLFKFSHLLEDLPQSSHIQLSKCDDSYVLFFVLNVGGSF